MGALMSTVNTALYFNVQGRNKGCAPRLSMCKLCLDTWVRKPAQDGEKVLFWEHAMGQGTI